MDDCDAVVRLLMEVMNRMESHEPVDFAAVRAQKIFHSDQLTASPSDEAGGGSRLSELIDVCAPVVDLLEAGDTDSAGTAFRTILKRWQESGRARCANAT